MCARPSAPPPSSAIPIFERSTRADAEVARVVGGLEKIAALKIIPTVKIDPALLGGVSAELGGKIYDGSLATRLAEAKRRLAG